MLRYLYLLIVLLNFSCETLILSPIGGGIGIVSDNSNFAQKECSLKELLKRETPKFKRKAYKSYASILGFAIDIPVGIAIAVSEPITGLKIVGGFIYIWSTGWVVTAMNMDSPPRLYYEENSWLPKNWADCRNSGDFFHSLQIIRINLKQDIILEERKKLCSLETNKLIEKAYLSLAEYNFHKPQKNLLNELKKKLSKPEIFPLESHFYINKSETGLELECAYRIIFYYKGGKVKLKEDF